MEKVENRAQQVVAFMSEISEHETNMQAII